MGSMPNSLLPRFHQALLQLLHQSQLVATEHEMPPIEQIRSPAP